MITTAFFLVPTCGNGAVCKLTVATKEAAICISLGNKLHLMPPHKTSTLLLPFLLLIMGAAHTEHS